MKNLKILKVLLLCLSITITSVGCQAKENDLQIDNSKELKKVTLNMVTVSPVYAPLLVAINEGYFEDEGIEVESSTMESNSKIIQQVLSGSCDIGYAGPEQSLYTYLEGKENHAVIFAETNKKNNGLLVSRNKVDNFNLDMLKGKTVIGSRPGGNQENTFEYVLKKNNIDPKTDLNIITNIALDSVAAAFQREEADYAIMFDPAASNLEKEGKGYIVASMGEECGNNICTCFYTSKSFIDKNPEKIQKFTNAIYKGQQWVKEHSAKEIAKVIKPSFPQIDEDILEKSIKKAKEIDLYCDTPVVNEDDYNSMINIVKSYDKTLVQESPDFNNGFVDNTFAKKSIIK